jgi:hypothetical protein
MFPCFDASPYRLCARAPFKNVELEIMIQCHGKFSCEMRCLLQSWLGNFVSSNLVVSSICNLLLTAGLSFVILLPQTFLRRNTHIVGRIHVLGLRKLQRLMSCP